MAHDDDARMWRWGDVFEVELPDTLIVKDLGDAIELAPAAPHETNAQGRVHLAVLSPLVTDPASSVRDAITRFAATHGLQSLPSTHLEVHGDAQGIATGRFAFVVGDTAWLVLALAWARHLVLAFATAPGPADPIFDMAEALLAQVRPLEVTAPAELAPEPPGEF